ncbi:MAG: amylo-alpha-1,6-glucosidase [Bacteroidota bacterium]
MEIARKNPYTRSSPRMTKRGIASRILHLLGFLSFVSVMVLAQGETPFLSRIFVSKSSPLYTTYAAALEESQFLLDLGYHFVFYDSTRGIEFSNNKAGDLCLAFKFGEEYVYKLDAMYSGPVITTSYGNIVKYFYYPFKSIRVDAAFLVYSSRIAVQDLLIQNTGDQSAEFYVVPFLRSGFARFHTIRLQEHENAITFRYFDLPDSWMVDHNIPHIDTVLNVFLFSIKPDRVSSFENFPLGGGGGLKKDSAQVVAFFKRAVLKPDGSVRLRVIRAVAPAKYSDEEELINSAEQILGEDLEKFVKADEALYSRIPHIKFTSSDEEVLYWSAFTLLRQSMLPPEGKCSYNYYVFSREPQWGWGHGGQVFHESLSMLAYVYMDPMSAMNSQRVYMERQHPDGYINYRTGPYLDETIPYDHELTSSAPWFNWENWEIYKVTRDSAFLREAYESGKKFYKWWTMNRDSDDDGLYEWGGHAVLESVRDGDVAVWDQVGWPSHFEALDLNCMLVKEAKSLASMAEELGYAEDAKWWKSEAHKRTDLINKYMWDQTTGFYYNVNKADHSFTYKKRDDLKRQEIIGFLPLWAGVADSHQAELLVKNLTDTTKFWRKYGAPSLSASDSYYNPKGYWNGPVWVEWEYLVFRGLLDYAYITEAKQLMTKVLDNVLNQLKAHHYFWELYSPDENWGGWHHSYIWTGLVARMLIDVHGL